MNKQTSVILCVNVELKYILSNLRYISYINDINNLIIDRLNNQLHIMLLNALRPSDADMRQ